MKNVLLFLLMLTPWVLTAQNRFSKTDVSENIVAENGITCYDQFNPILNGDKQRMYKGHVFTGMAKDYYANGQMAHKGYYIDGKLQFYKNFYPNGTLEREYNEVNNTKTAFVQHFPNGEVKSQSTYVRNTPVKMVDFYENGNVKFYEEMSARKGNVKVRNSYFENGNPHMLLELVDIKENDYSMKEFHDNGLVSEQGTIAFDPVYNNYSKIGNWAYFNEAGLKVKENTYISGDLAETEEY